MNKPLGLEIEYLSPLGPCWGMWRGLLYRGLWGIRTETGSRINFGPYSACKDQTFVL